MSIDVAMVSRDGFIRPAGPFVPGPAIIRWPLILGPSSLQGTPAGDWVLIGASDLSKVLSSLQNTLYAYQENYLRLLPTGE